MGQITLPISEIFYSLQGEGKLAGKPSIFVRLAGCPIRCDWCDTGYAWDENSSARIPIDMILKQITDIQYQLCNASMKCNANINCGAKNIRDIVITGGEPLAHYGIECLTNELVNSNFYVTIETSGAFLRQLECSLMSISPKLDNPRYQLKPNVIRQLISQSDDYQLKFVISERNELEKISEFLKMCKFVERDKIMLMPRAKTKTEYDKIAPIIANLAIEYNFRFSPRLHIALGLK